MSVIYKYLPRKAWTSAVFKKCSQYEIFTHCLLWLLVTITKTYICEKPSLFRCMTSLYIQVYKVYKTCTSIAYCIEQFFTSYVGSLLYTAFDFQTDATLDQP